MVGAENSIKVVSLMVLYFGLMAIIITLVSNISGTTITTTGGTGGLYVGEWCNQPRTMYEQFITDPIDTLSMNSYVFKHTVASLDCGKTAGIIDQTSCETIDGCAWSDPANWFQQLFGMGGVDTCTGTIGYGINSTYIIGFGNTASTNGSVVATCDYPSVKYNETLCEVFSCTWSYTDGVEDLDITTEQNAGMFKKTMKTLGSMLTLQFSYGFTNPTASLLLNLLLFWIPLIILLIAIYQLIPLI